jgi:pimeloyl-ACP methyl ester carboxylesterase
MAEQRARAIAHDGTDIPYEVAGSGSRWLFLGLGGGTASDPASQQPWIEALGGDYRLIFIDYPGEPKMYTLTPAAVARDYLAIADAAGADRFAYYGFSWGAVSGLQLALRTERLTAFVAGGFPMVHGPYAELLRIVRAGEQGPIQLYDHPPIDAPEYSRQFVTYYEGLRSFDDRAAQSRVRCPRLNFCGTADDVLLNGALVTRLGGTIAEHREELEAYGWEVRLLEGMTHVGPTGAARPEVAIPIVREFLERSAGRHAG